MDRKTDDIIEAIGGYAEFENRVKQGRKLHDQAVAELFSQLIPSVIRFLKGKIDTAFKTHAAKDQYQAIYMKRSSRYPV